MRLEIVPRRHPSRAMRIAAPVIAFALTLVVGAALFAGFGIDPLRGLNVYFFEPLTQSWALQEIAVKAAPLALIATGLAVCFRSNNWNIGAEGQFTIGAIAGSAVPILGFSGPQVPTLLLMALFGAAGGALYAAIPALLKNRFGASEILTSLMLSYVALLFLDWIVRGPWRDPGSYNFPESALFGANATLPILVDRSRLHLGTVVAPLAALAVAWLLARSLRGFAIRLSGAAPRAARFAGFRADRMTLFAFMLSGALAGLAGIFEVSGVIGQLRPEISPGYGFTAIIVAFLGRLHPLGIVGAAFLLALTYIGGEAAQITLRLPANVTAVFQGLLLLIVLAVDTLVVYHVRLRPAAAPVTAHA